MTNANTSPIQASPGSVSRLTVLHQTAELLVVNKPAGLVCHPTKGDEYSSLISRARLHLGVESEPQLINRLDRETSGIVILACEPVTARELRRAWEARDVRKVYLAIVHGWVAEDQGVVEAALGPDEQSRVAIKDRAREDGKPARTDFRVVRRFRQNPGLFFGSEEPLEKFTLLELKPETGRKHQIRIHLAHKGHPIVGDKIYGADEDCYLALVEDRLTDQQRRALILPHQALHACSVAFTWRDQDMRFEAQPEEWFRTFLGEGELKEPS